MTDENAARNAVSARPQPGPSVRSRARRPDALKVVDLNSTGGPRMARRGMLSTIGVAVQGATRFVMNVLVGRIGGPAVLGAVASATSTAQLLALLWPTTTGSAASKFVAQSRGRSDPAEASAVAAHLAKRTLQAGSVLGAAAIPVWAFIDHGSWASTSAVAALVLGYSGYNFTRGLQYGAGQVARATTWDVTTAVLGLIGVLAALLLGVRGVYVLLPLAGSYMLFTIAGWPWGVHGSPAPALRREMDAFVALGVVGTVASAGFLQLSMIVARATDGLERAGQYAAALALATPPSLLAMSISLVLFPSMAEAWGRQDLVGFKKQTDRATRALVTVMTAIFGSIALCGSLIVSLIWGKQYNHAAVLLPILLLAILANTMGVAATNSLTSRSHRGMVTSTVSSLCGMAFGTLLWALLAPRFGTVGVAIGYLGGTAMIAGIPITIVWRRDKHQWAGLALRTAGGLAVLVGLLMVERTLLISLWIQPAVALVFLVSWLVLMGPNARTAILRRQWT